MKHLWEVDHAYYCAEENFYAPGNGQPFQSYKTFSNFLEAEGDANLDMNLVFRWDWYEGPDWGAGDYNGDDNYRNGKLMIFFMGQRKGLYRWAEIEVCRADEEAVKAYLAPRLQHLLSLWEPLTTPAKEA